VRIQRGRRGGREMRRMIDDRSTFNIRVGVRFGPTLLFCLCPQCPACLTLTIQTDPEA
jgi:hypothetical protein